MNIEVSVTENLTKLEVYLRGKTKKITVQRERNIIRLECIYDQKSFHRKKEIGRVHMYSAFSYLV